MNREVVPYVIEGWVSEFAGKRTIIKEHVPGLDLFLDTEAIDGFAIERAKRRLADALAALNSKTSSATAKATIIHMILPSFVASKRGTQGEEDDTRLTKAQTPGAAINSPGDEKTQIDTGRKPRLRGGSRPE